MMEMSMKELRVAIAQIRGVKADLAYNKKRVMEMIEQAHELQADYLLFPEFFLTGNELSIASDHTASSSIHVSTSAMLAEIGEQCRRYQIGVVIGLVEAEADQQYNAAVLIDKQGKTVGTYRKIHLFEYEQSRFSHGRELPVFDLPEVRMGIMISHDMEYPEVARILALNGAQLLVVLSSSTVLDTEQDSLYLRGRAMENHLFIACANKVGLEDNQLFAGGSKWIHPSGDILYTCSHNEELAVHQLQLTDIEHTKGALDYLKNRRPDIYEKEGYKQV
ncbi:MAG: carbon-nitrogen hydrolase family protein [Clostridia bacterium]